MVAMTAPDIFTYQNLSDLQELTIVLQQIEGVGQVRSLTSSDAVRGSEWGGIELSPLIGVIPQDLDALAELKRTILADPPMYSGSMVAPTADAALVVVEVKPQADAVSVAAAVQKQLNRPPQRRGGSLCNGGDSGLKPSLSRFHES